MTVSLFSATVPAYLQALPPVLGVIAKAEAHTQATGLAPAELIGARLAPDMWNFGEQIRALTLHSGAALEAAISGELAPAFPEPPVDFAGLHQLVEAAIAKVRAISPEQLDAAAERDTVLRFGAHRVEYVTQDFLLSFALPNFYFHTTAAYAILRSNGVPLGKTDFIGASRRKVVAAA